MYPYRCSNCAARRSLARKIKDYVIIPACRTCGVRRYYLDKWRIRHEMGIRPTCDCGGYHFRHRKGSGYCYFHADAEARNIERRA